MSVPGDKPKASSTQDTSLTGNIRIPGYLVEAEIGRGAVASVYLAIQESLDRKVALKVMSPALAAEADFSERFEREGRTVAQFSHPNIVTIFDVGVANYQHYIAMEYLGGGSLKHKLGDAVDAHWALDIVAQIAAALGYAHSQGYVHRDVKPENVLFRSNGEAVLTDFGIAKSSSSNTQLTRSGTIVGTPRYMSPEQAQGYAATARSDIYSLGIILFEMLAGEPPFQTPESLAVLYSHINDPIPELPTEQDLQGLVDVMMAKDPIDRVPDCQTLLELIQVVRNERQQPTLTGLSTRNLRRPGKALLPAGVTRAANDTLPDIDLAIDTEQVRVRGTDSNTRWRWVAGVATLVAALVSLELFSPGRISGLLGESNTPTLVATDTPVRELNEGDQQLLADNDVNGAITDTDTVISTGSSDDTDNAVIATATDADSNTVSATDSVVDEAIIGPAPGDDDALVVTRQADQTVTEIVTPDVAAQDDAAEPSLVASQTPLPADGPVADDVLVDEPVAIPVVEPTTSTQLQPVTPVMTTADQVDASDGATEPAQADDATAASQQHSASAPTATVSASPAPKPVAKAPVAVVIDRGEIERLLEIAQRLQAEDRVSSPSDENAVATYQKILQIDPDHQQASLSLSAIATDYYKRARQRFGEDNLAEASVDVGRGLDAVTDHPELKTLEAILRKRIEGESAYKDAQAYAAGDGVPRDYERACRRYLQAAQADHIEAMVGIGVCYATGQGVDKDDQRAIDWLERAGSAGSAKAQYWLGLGYLFSDIQDAPSAAYWMKAAVEQDYQRAFRVLGWMYRTGTGVEESATEAVRWGFKGVLGEIRSSDNTQRKQVTLWETRFEKAYADAVRKQERQPRGSVKNDRNF